jgi:sRNA-binding carbon storage regulator CsrA
MSRENYGYGLVLTREVGERIYIFPTKQGMDPIEVTLVKVAPRDSANEGQARIGILADRDQYIIERQELTEKRINANYSGEKNGH